MPEPYQSPTQVLITFGQKYRNQDHPTFPEAHPDAVLAVQAPTYGLAMDLVKEYLGTDYAFSYPTRVPAQVPHATHTFPSLTDYPQGITHTLTAHQGIQTVQEATGKNHVHWAHPTTEQE